MKNFQYVLAIFFLRNSMCTIDISIPEYQYISQRLTSQECRRLYTSLHFPTFELPAGLAAAEKKVPKAPCLKLLTKWDKGTQKWEGRDRSYVDVARRLRQIGRRDLAEWLSKTVFTRLVKEVNDALNTNFSNRTMKREKKLHIDKKDINNDWTINDAIMWAILAGLVMSLVILLGKIVTMCCKRIGMKKKKAKEEEIMELLNYGSVDSDQETIYECVVKSNRVDENDRYNGE